MRCVGIMQEFIVLLNMTVRSYHLKGV